MTGVAIALGLLLSGCASDKNGDLCDFYQALGTNYMHMQNYGYIPSDVQDEIDKYC